MGPSWECPGEEGMGGLVWGEEEVVREERGGRVGCTPRELRPGRLAATGAETEGSWVREARRKEGKEEGRQGGRKARRKEGKEEGRQGGRKARRKEGKEEGRQGGRKARRKEGKEEGRQGGRKEEGVEIEISF